MKELKDYLPLYIGQFVYIFPDETLTNGWLHKKLIKLPELQWKLEVTPETLSKRITDNYKLILRPLESMSGAERELLWYGTSGVEIRGEIPSGHTVFFTVTPDHVLFLLRKGFDLFGLKEAGLAVYEDIKK